MTDDVDDAREAALIPVHLAAAGATGCAAVALVAACLMLPFALYGEEMRTLGWLPARPPVALVVGITVLAGPAPPVLGAAFGATYALLHRLAATRAVRAIDTAILATWMVLVPGWGFILNFHAGTFAVLRGPGTVAVVLVHGLALAALFGPWRGEDVARGVLGAALILDAVLAVHFVSDKQMFAFFLSGIGAPLYGPLACVIGFAIALAQGGRPRSWRIVLATAAVVLGLAAPGALHAMRSSQGYQLSATGSPIAQLRQMTDKLYP